jgi:hypothetical protein
VKRALEHSETANVLAPVTGARIVGCIIASVAVGLMITGDAFAATPAASIPNGPFKDNQTISVSGSGFPTQAQDPAGLQIIECTDPGGSPANLPTDATEGCEGISVNPSQVNTNGAGKFSTSYLILALGAATSSINCDASHFCVLWVGTDYNNAFTSGPHAFTAPFEVVGTASSDAQTTHPAGRPVGASNVAPGSVGSSTSSNSSVPVAGALATTGVPALLLWILGMGLLLTVLGVSGRRWIAGGAPGVPEDSE